MKILFKKASSAPVVLMYHSSAGSDDWKKDFLDNLIPVCFCSCRERQARISPHTLMPCMGQRELRALEDQSLSACQDSRTLPNLVRESGKEGGSEQMAQGLNKSLCPEYRVSEYSFILLGENTKKEAIFTTKYSNDHIQACYSL